MEITEVANSRLIAAAPELLEIAKYFVTWVDDVWGSAALGDITKAEYGLAKAAIAKVEGRNNGNDDEQRANAYLIAAAPEMLEALKRIRDSASNAPQLFPYVVSAIAKAEGR